MLHFPPVLRSKPVCPSHSLQYLLHIFSAGRSQGLIGKNVIVDYGDISAEKMSLPGLYHKLQHGNYAAPEDLIADVLHMVRNMKNRKPPLQNLANAVEKQLWIGVRRVPQWAHIQPSGFESTESERKGT